MDGVSGVLRSKLPVKEGMRSRAAPERPIAPMAAPGTATGAVTTLPAAEACEAPKQSTTANIALTLKR